MSGSEPDCQPGRVRGTCCVLAPTTGSATWRVISAQRANRLLRDMLFERVFAVRTPGFDRAYRNAEVDMHFSLTTYMVPLDEVLDVLAREGSQGVVGRSMRGVI